MITPRRVLLACVGLGFGVLALAAFVSAQFDVPDGMLTRDIAALAAGAGAHLPPFAGALSTINVMVWDAAATLTAGVAALRPGRRRWLMIFAALLAVLAIDDAFLVHERVDGLGVPEQVFFVAYTAVAAVLLVLRRSEGRTAASVAFVLGGAFLAGSVVLDLVAHDVLLEDGLKLVGAMTWLCVAPFTLWEAMPATSPDGTLLGSTVDGTPPGSATGATQTLR